jgi:hypothetical protein
MGVDISGINPNLKSPKPEQPDWDTSSNETMSAYWESLSEWQEENPGYYFRASWWTWRPIVHLIDYASNLYNLGIETKSMHYNDGEGIRTQEECNKLADALENVLNSDERLSEEDAVIYLCLGSWCDTLGMFIPSEETEKLQKDHPIGTLLFTPVVLSNGTLAVSSHSVGVDYVKEFITFLRQCGGFQVW